MKERQIVLTIRQDEDGSWTVGDNVSLAYGWGSASILAVRSWAHDLASRYGSWREDERENRIGKAGMDELAAMREVLA